MDGGPAIVCTGLPAALAERVVQHADLALRGVELAAEVSGLRICADDLPGEDEGWFALDRLARGRGSDRQQPALVLYCHQESFGAPRSATSTVFPPPSVWDSLPGPHLEAGLNAKDFRPERTDIFLHHQLLTARDLIRRELVPSRVPRDSTEAFAALWAVIIDGRLERAGLPGYPMVERRSRFSRLFASAGILMPEHWQTFQSLWDGALPTQSDILGLMRHLPRL